MEPVSLWLVAAHLMGDFPLQPTWMARKKAWLHSTGERPEGAVTLLLHITIHGILVAPIALVTLTGSAQWVFVAWVIISHAVIDCRRWMEPREGWGHDGMMWVWLNDQIFHLVALAFAYPVTELIV